MHQNRPKPQKPNHQNGGGFDEDRFRNKRTVTVHVSSGYSERLARLAQRLENQLSSMATDYGKGRINGNQYDSAERRIRQVVEAVQQQIEAALNAARPRSRQNRPQPKAPRVVQIAKPAVTTPQKPAEPPKPASEPAAAKEEKAPEKILSKTEQAAARRRKTAATA